MHPSVKDEPKLVEALATVDRQMEIARYYSTLADGQQRKINTEMALGPVLERGTPPSSDHGPGGSGDDEFVPSTDSSPVLSIHSESGRDVVGA
jgi:hypothetical protein